MNRKALRNSILSALFAALVFLMIWLPFLHLPIPGTTGYIHFGDAILFLCAALLPFPYAAFAVFGAALADLLLGPIWIPATVLIKVGSVALLSCRADKLATKKNILAAFLCTVFCVVGYYVWEGIVYGDFGAALISIPYNLIQGIGSAIFFTVLALALDRIHFKQTIERGF